MLEAMYFRDKPIWSPLFSHLFLQDKFLEANILIYNIK